MKNDITCATETINTLVYKAEASGDPTNLMIENRSLKEQIEKLKLEDLLRRREMEELRATVNDLRKEIEEFREKVDVTEIENLKIKKELSREISKNKKIN